MWQTPINERCFEIIDGVLYVFDRGLLEADISVEYFWKIKSTGNSKVDARNHPKFKQKNIYAYETLSDQHKEKIKARFKNPYQFVTRAPILQLIQRNATTEKFFLDYRYNGNDVLPVKRIKQYTRACDWLDLLKKVNDSKNKIIKELGINVPEFYNHLAELMNEEKKNGANDKFIGSNQLPSKFPTSYRKLHPKVKEYIQDGPAILIDKMFGNQLASKIFDETCEAQLLSLIEDPRQLDDVMVCSMYNIWAYNNGYKIIQSGTVGVWRRKNEALISIGRFGNSAFNEKIIRQVKGQGPSAPLFLAEHDDNNLDFLYQDKTGNPFNRYISIVVTDSFCNLVLGKSYAPITKDMKDTLQQLVHHAYLDAMYYIRSLTGGWFLPFEIKSDKFAWKSLTPFYEKISKFIPPSHGNKHRGYIEQFFRSPLWKRSQQLVSEQNWSGHNISAKYTGVNPDMLDRSMKEKSRPMIGDQAETQIESFFYLLRNLPDFKRNDMNAPSKQKQWLEAWNKLSIEQKRPITEEQMLLTFGITHEPQNRTISITNRGVEPQINGNKYSYDLPDSVNMMKYIGAKVNVVYDPFDMSRVLITNFDDIRFIAHTAQLQPRALEDQYTGSRTYLNAILAEKKEQVNQVSRLSEKRKAMADISYYNAEAMLHGGVLPKHLKNKAEQILLEGTNGLAYDPLDEL